jgi:16S rRNA processing protein RimM
MIPEKSNLHLLGAFTKLHGYKGELTAFVDSANMKDYESLQHLYVEVKGHLVPYIVQSIEYKTNKTMKVKLEGVDNEAMAKALVKCEIYIVPDAISEPDALREELRSIEGYNVIDEEEGEIGRISMIDDNKVNPLLEITSDEAVILLPLHQDFIIEVVHEARTLYVAAPPGLIDFYRSQP